MNVLGKNKSRLSTHLSAALILAAISTACGSSNNGSGSTVVNPDQQQPDNAPIPVGQVALTSINGAYDSNQAKTLSVHIGDVITLSADVLADTTGQATYTRVEAFKWSAQDSATDVCDASAAQDCLATSNFQVNNYGVAFYVPSTIGQQMTITVSKKDDAANASTLTLVNADYSAETPAPTEVVTDPTQYHQDQLDPTLALNGQGHWVYINGNRYWSPKAYLTDGEEEWSPYRHGYWSWDASQNSMVWISYDPWGWMTDHYGVWRYHGVYGWIWSPFTGADYYYRPHTVSWFDDGSGYIGWYPYHSSYARGYHDGFEFGFRDGFWLGFNVGRDYGTAGYGYHPGYTIVHTSHFTNQNIVSVYEHTRGNATVMNVVTNANSNNRYGAMPRAETQARLGTIPSTRILTVGAGHVQYAEASHPVPARYNQVASTIRSSSNNHAAPVGSIIDARGTSTVTVVHATNNGRGVVVAPVGHDAHGQVVTLPPQTTRVAVANPKNPEIGTRDGAIPQATKPGTTPTRPVIQNPQPTRPQPTPVRPAPTPVRPAPTPGRTRPSSTI